MHSLQELLKEFEAQSLDLKRRLETNQQIIETITKAIELLQERECLEEWLNPPTKLARESLERALAGSVEDQAKKAEFRLVKPNSLVNLPWFCDPEKGGLHESKNRTKA
jgi:hypothetical protein